MKISDLGRATDTKPVTIRFYEKIGILSEPERTAGNYRRYTNEHVRRLIFVRQLRALGFELADIRLLLELVDQPDCAASREALSGHWRATSRKIEHLTALRRELERLINGDAIGFTRLLDVMADQFATRD